jgi:chaperonin cofactor prefoldin
MAAIISEWGLVTTHTLDNLDDRLEAVTAEIRSLEKGRDEIGKRVAALEAGIRELEA